VTWGFGSAVRGEEMEFETRLERVVYKTTLATTAVLIYVAALSMLVVVLAALWGLLYLVGG
jgi:hypothetical protein